MTALVKIRSKLKPNNYKELEELEYLADSVRQHSEELIIEKWRLLEELSEKNRRGLRRKGPASMGFRRGIRRLAVPPSVCIKR